MSKASREEIQQLNDDLSEARDCLDREEWAPAREKYLVAQAKAQSLGIESPYLLWALSLAQERLGEVEESFRLVSAAIVADPMHPTLTNRFSEAAAALRQRLEFASRHPAGKHLARIYQALLRSGEADAGSHVAMARAELAQGDVEAARKLLESTTLLEPSRIEAWRLMAEVARKQGDVAAAAEADSHVAELEGREAPYGVPSPPTSC